MANVSIDGYVSKTISDICRNLNDDSLNHCAHFVSHVLGIQFGYTCSAQSGKSLSPSANIRVQELFARCPTVAEWDDTAAKSKTLLVFVTKKGNLVDLKTKTFGNIPKKHVGVLWRDNIYHYSNSAGQVMKQAPADFFTRMAGAYGPLQKFTGTLPVEVGNQLV
ncbi:hypothetical protein [Inquilinus limosus]|uniref:Uncharacterized protein n=1 Tax=Inquilinus limosus TaxID=171674 RepID=A0A211ZU23_9PROT|nr:hypothetical protein [Inquilinus limosus]OWJ68577.1 hypothetical protein BWR60_03980 [Inquilinus limosus]